MKVNQLKIREDVITGDMLEGLQVFDDDQTRYKSIALNFTFASGVKGFLIVTRIAKDQWDPSQEIESITIKTKA